MADPSLVDSYRPDNDTPDSVKYRLLPSPNPLEVILAIRVNHDALQPSMLAALVIGVTTFSQMPRITIPLRIDEFANYVFTDKIVASPTSYWFLFGPPKTVAEANVPFRSTTSFGNHPWYPILLKLNFLRDPSFPHVINSSDGAGNFGITTAPRTFVREVYIPGASEGTRFLKEEFTSPVQFNIPSYQVPLASHVTYDFLGVSGGFPECLHDDIDIPPQSASLATYYTTGGVAGGGGVVGQKFPRTNFTTWQPYVTKDDQELKDGMWYRVRIRVYPPPLPKVITE